MSENNNFQQQNKILTDTINLRKKIISLNEDVKKTQEEIKEKIYKMLNFRKSNTKFNLNYLKEYAKKREETKQIEINKEKNQKIENNKESYQKINLPSNKQINKEKSFENLIFLKNSVSDEKINESYFFTDEEETWIPEIKKENKNESANKYNSDSIPFYEWIHKKG